MEGAIHRSMDSHNADRTMTWPLGSPYRSLCHAFGNPTHRAHLNIEPRYPPMNSYRFNLRASLTTLAFVTGASPLFAQRCVGIAMPRRTYIGAETRHAWTGEGRQARVYGGRIAHRLETRGGLGITASVSGAGGPIRGDSNVVHLSGLLALSRSLPAFSEKLSACVASGFEVHGVDVTTPGAFISGNGDGFASGAVTAGLGYDLTAGAWTITPFAAPSIARYAFESALVANGAQQRGWDGYVTFGATASTGRWSVGATSRHGERATRQGGRFALRAGASF